LLFYIVAELVDPANLERIFVSPRQRAQKTFELLFGDHISELKCGAANSGSVVETTENVREWDYGEYEGLHKEEIEKKQPGWDIWSQGCPGGESVEEITARVDQVIADVREVHRKYKVNGDGKRDVMIFSHG
jgi:probable phosphoglycerate mutase